MPFNIKIGLEKTERENLRINSREAVRAVILRSSNLLMVQTNKGDLKFPGGGAKSEEQHEETIKREVKEETGYLVENIIENLGIFTERNIDQFDKDSIFEMVSHYYLCGVSALQSEQQLDDYEAELDFRPKWIDIDEAIRNNEKVIADNCPDMNAWVHRETMVLREIKTQIQSRLNKGDF